MNESQNLKTVSPEQLKPGMLFVNHPASERIYTVDKRGCHRRVNRRATGKERRAIRRAMRKASTT